VSPDNGFSDIARRRVPTKHLVRQINKYRYSVLCAAKSAHTIFVVINAKSNGNKSQLSVQDVAAFFQDVHQFLANYRDHSDTVFCKQKLPKQMDWSTLWIQIASQSFMSGVKRKHNGRSLEKAHRDGLRRYKIIETIRNPEHQ